jgi:putative ABC transport system permease protein
MFSLIANPILERQPRSFLLAIGLVIISASVMLIAFTSQITMIAMEHDLGRFWRTTYDILVRPSGERSEIEEQYGLVEANHLSGIWGGITFEQYEAIKAIPGVEVAAPLAMLGYVQEIVSADVVDQLHEPGVYTLKMSLRIEDRSGLYETIPRKPVYYYYIGSDVGSNVTLYDANRLFANPVRPPFSHLEFPFLVAGIDPVQEAALVGLHQAMVEGDYLTGSESLVTRPRFQASGGPATEIDAPILINATTYTSITQLAELRYLELSDDVFTLADIQDRGGTTYLETLPADTIAVQELSSADLYHILIEGLRERGFSHSFAVDLPGRMTYRPATYILPDNELVLEIMLPEEGQGYLIWPAYRSTHIGQPLWFDTAFRPVIRGIFDIERIPQPEAVRRIPLETYFPPVAILRYDEQGQPVELPRVLRPTLNPAGYIQNPPLVLTTLEAAQLIKGNETISAIRVRVALEGCSGDYLTCPLTLQNQRKIETIAGEIARLTGLDVDIMVGSSPTRILVHVPGVGYVEEQWIQKNVTATYQERVQTGHLILLAALLGIGGLFVLDLAWAEVVARRRTIALQKALGWRSSTVFAQVLGHLLLVSTLAAILGALAAWGVTGLLGWQPPPMRLLAGVPLLVVLLSLLGSLYPAWLAARTPPVIGLQQGNIRPTTRNRPGSSFLPLPSAFFLLAWRGLARRWSRSALGALTAALSAALLVLMLGVTVDRQGVMSGTLLGEFILVRIEGYHYAIVGIGFGLAALSLANSLLAGVLERRREIGVLKAVGWRTPTVARLFILEGALLGVLGGVAGAALGLVTFVGLYETISPSLGWIGLVGVLTPVIVGALAATYPARVAARVPPAEAVRYE